MTPAFCGFNHRTHFTQRAATRSIGRLLNDTSPVIVTSNGCPASRPANRRGGTGITHIQLARWRLKAVSTDTVDRHATGIRPLYLDTHRLKGLQRGQRIFTLKKAFNGGWPSAIAPNIMERWEIDLSPGTRTVPFTVPPG